MDELREEKLGGYKMKLTAYDAAILNDMFQNEYRRLREATIELMAGPSDAILFKERAHGIESAIKALDHLYDKIVDAGWCMK